MALTSEQRQLFEILKNALLGDGASLENVFGGFVPGQISSDNINNDSDDVAGLTVSDALDANKAEIDTNAGNIASNDADIAALDVRVTTNEGNITALDGRVTVNEGDIATLQSQVAGLQTRVNALENPPYLAHNPPGPLSTSSGTYVDLDVVAVGPIPAGLYLVDVAVIYGGTANNQTNTVRLNISDGVDTVIGEDLPMFARSADDNVGVSQPVILNEEVSDRTVTFTLQGRTTGGSCEVRDYKLRFMRIGDADLGGGFVTEGRRPT